MIVKKNSMLNEIELEQNEKIKVNCGNEEVFLFNKNGTLFIDHVSFESISKFIIECMYNSLNDEWDNKALENYIKRNFEIYKR